MQGGGADFKPLLSEVFSVFGNEDLLCDADVICYCHNNHNLHEGQAKFPIFWQNSCFLFIFSTSIAGTVKSKMADPKWPPNDVIWRFHQQKTSLLKLTAIYYTLTNFDFITTKTQRRSIRPPLVEVQVYLKIRGLRKSVLKKKKIAVW